jgi:DNA-binding MarR family transcriptional regulator
MSRRILVTGATGQTGRYTTDIRIGTLKMAIADVDTSGLCNCTKLRRAARHVSRFYDAQLAGSGLRVTQYAILGHLKDRGPKSMLELAELMTMDRTTIGHNLRLVERDGLVKIEVSPKDRRVRLVSITEAGLERVALGRPGWDRAQAEFQAEFGAANTVAMHEMMDHVVACGLGENS